MDATDIQVDVRKLREARERRGFTQEQVATAVGVKKAAISKIETGLSLPSATILARMCKVYEISTEDITSQDCAA